MKKAFTLVEILFVMVIVSVLFAIAWSVYSSAHTKSQETVCMENLRQIGMGIKMYESDYGDLPHEFKMLHPSYVSDARVFRCPVWDALATTKAPEEQEKIRSIFSLYSYQPEERRFWNETAPREAGDPEAFHHSWEKAYALRGEKLPLVTCQFHDPTLFSPRALRFVGADGHIKITNLVLRLDGSVSKSTLRPQGKGGNWYDQ